MNAILRELELKPATIAVLVAGWVVIWVVCILAGKPLTGVAASACWLSAVATALAWTDLWRFRRRWERGEYHSGRMPLRHHWWLAPLVLVVGVLFGYRFW